MEEARRDAFQYQDKELFRIFPELNLQSRIQVVQLARKLAQEERKAALFRRFMEAFNQLNEEGQRIALEYVKALAADPRYRV